LKKLASGKRFSLLDNLIFAGFSDCGPCSEKLKAFKKECQDKTAPAAKSAQTGLSANTPNPVYIECIKEGML
jgi:hypothetical protein